MTDIQEENRKRWVRDLWACVQWHREKAEETAPMDLVGVSESTKIFFFLRNSSISLLVR